ncbi:beta-1,3-galactosyltransferase GALT1-like [Coffea arabica]|uniref:Beta-1,3-galactosyltransferase GALT1-like n=1 Tax=Coffea arabica TaxID=13443 RepID=A0A6P6VCV9_COFAR|nr:beta-1,3-galactosyltransferase GALT1-like [Coffea arabica]XP_027100502.1 beta-1,3-galactosyltransferase GALT1-like [Coffea arabica]
MKKWYAGVFFTSLVMLLVLGYYVMQNPLKESNLTSLTPILNSTNPLEWITAGAPAVVQNPEKTSQVISADILVSDLFVGRNISDEEKQSLHTWNHLQHLVSHAQVLPNALEATKEAVVAWKNLLASVEDEKLHMNESSQRKGKEKQCPHYLSKMNATELDDNGFRLQVPCGLTQGSSITFIGIPHGLLGNFRIDLTGEPLPGEPDPPIILHYNVRLLGDQITEDPVIVQNTWTIAHDWGEEERCPSPNPEKNKKVDELDQCNQIVGKDDNHTTMGGKHLNVSTKTPMVQDVSKPKKYFPFKQGNPFVATLRVGSEGIQMTVDGKHITSFGFRETLEPWLVNEVRIAGNIKLISVLSSGLPTSEDLEHIVDIKDLKAPPLPPHRQLNLFIGVFSTTNNFKRRMAVRRTWMQYGPVRSGTVAVRFFVGLHKNQVMNEELWNEAKTYGDIQLMPFVDYYSLITWKTLAICVFGTQVVSAKFVMKTDDDAFVRVDEILASLNRINVSRGLLYGLINSDSHPHRSPDSKWYISPEEWPDDSYPPWAHGPGYVVSNDIAQAIYKRYRKGQLKMFKLEDVAMGIWISDMKKQGLEVKYETDERIFNVGCRDGYVIAHYQGPREMLCLWQKLQEAKRANCCGD